MMMVAAERFGKDHFSLVGYLGCRAADHDNQIDHAHMRTNENRHPKLDFRHSGQSWESKYGTRLKGYFDAKKESPEAAAKLQLPDHDDWDCADDLEANGLVVMGGIASGVFTFLPLGLEVLGEVTKHKAAGGNFAGVELPVDLLERIAEARQSLIAETQEG